jgi:DNA-damage-inducible protein J
MKSEIEGAVFGPFWLKFSWRVDDGLEPRLTFRAPHGDVIEDLAEAYLGESPCISYEIQLYPVQRPRQEVFMSGSPTSMIHIRVDETVKKQAVEALGKMGLSLSEAVRVLLTRVAADQAFPFQIRVPNAETRAAMEEARGMSHARFATAEDLFDALAKNGK